MQGRLCLRQATARSTTRVWTRHGGALRNFLEKLCLIYAWNISRFRRPPVHEVKLLSKIKDSKMSFGTTEESFLRQRRLHRPKSFINIYVSANQLLSNTLFELILITWLLRYQIVEKFYHYFTSLLKLMENITFPNVYATWSYAEIWKNAWVHPISKEGNETLL